MQGKNKQRIAEFNRQNILNAAKMLFCENGIHQTTMDHIAKESQYSKSTIYVYFKSKDEAFHYIVYEYMVLLKQGLQEAINSSSDVTQCYYAICRTLSMFHETYPLYFDSILGEISTKQEDFDKCEILRNIYVVGEETNDMIRGFIEDGIIKKQLRADIKPLQTAFILWSSICGLISFASKKESYLQNGILVSKEDFLQYGFDTLLRSIVVMEGT